MPLDSVTDERPVRTIAACPRPRNLGRPAPARHCGGLTLPRGGGTLPGMARALGPALRNGLRRRCPACGRGPLFAGYLRPVRSCGGCGEPLGHIRADDFPPYIAILVAGHVVVPLLLLAEQSWAPPLWLQALVWPALALALVAVLLPVAKGGGLAAMWALGLLVLAMAVIKVGAR